VANPIASEIQASRDDSAQRRTLRGLLRREPPDAQAGAQAASAAPDSLSAQVQSVTVTAARRSDAAAALRRAAQVGDMAALNGLLVPPSDVDARDDRGCTALMLATLHGQRAAVDALLAAGADPNAADAQGRTPLQAAVAAGQSDIIAALQRAGAH
jgi:ankyrin repeat protein